MADTVRDGMPHICHKGGGDGVRVQRASVPHSTQTRERVPNVGEQLSAIAHAATCPVCRESECPTE